MTTLVPVPISVSTAEADSRTSDVPAPTGLRRKALGIAVIAGGALAVAGFATTRWEASDSKIDYLNSLDVNPLQSQIAALLLWSGYLLAFGSNLLVLAAMTRGMRSRLVTVAIGLGGIGAATLPGLLATDFYDLAIRQTLPDDLAVATSDKASSYGLGSVMAVPALLGLLLGLLVGLVAAARRGLVHWAVAPVFGVAFLVPVFAGAGALPNIAGPAVAFVALSTVGISALRMTDEQYHRGARV